MDCAAVGRYAEAETLNGQTLAVRERVLGPEHPDTMGSRHKLANGYSAVGRHTGAAALDAETLTERQAGG